MFKRILATVLALTLFTGPAFATLGNAAENALLSLVFENANYANIGDATGLRGSSTAGSYYISLHSADPGEAGNQTTSECAYTSYARVAVARSTAGWSVASAVADNDSAITFPAATGSSCTATYVAIGTDSSGAGNLVASGVLAASRSITNGIIPSFAAGALDITAD